MKSSFVPDQQSIEVAQKRARYLAIVAHPDDIEFMCFDGIKKGYQDKSFAGLVLCSGAGSARGESFKNLSDQEMIALRKNEQINAAKLGAYSYVEFWGLESSALKSPKELLELVPKMRSFLEAHQLECLYIHNPFDRHKTHVAASMLVLLALRDMPKNKRPKLCLGGELWRSLDWILPKYRVSADISSPLDLQKKLLEAFPSQSEGAKGYAEAILGRRRSHAVLLESHEIERALYVEIFLNLEFFLDSHQSLENLIAQFLKEHESELKIQIQPFLLEGKS